MLKKEVEIGATYRVRRPDGSFVNVLILSIDKHAMGSRWNPRTVTHYRAKNLKTGRIITIKSAAKLREKVD